MPVITSCLHFPAQLREQLGGSDIAWVIRLKGHLLNPALAKFGRSIMRARVWVRTFFRAIHGNSACQQRAQASVRCVERLIAQRQIRAAPPNHGPIITIRQRSARDSAA